MKQSILIPLVASLSGLALAQKVEVEVTKAVSCSRPTRNGDTVRVHYRGSLASDGREFDASYNRGVPLVFNLGSHQVIQGWEDGLLDMCEGEQRKLTIPPELAYGNRAVGPIPAGSTLIFETELVEIANIPHEDEQNQNEDSESNNRDGANTNADGHDETVNENTESSENSEAGERAEAKEAEEAEGENTPAEKEEGAPAEDDSTEDKTTEQDTEADVDHDAPEDAPVDDSVQDSSASAEEAEGAAETDNATHEDDKEASGSEETQEKDYIGRDEL